MPRTRHGVARHKRVNKILKQAKGYRGRRSKNYHTAKIAVMRALSTAYAHRKQKKREFRSLWIVRISAAAMENGLKYNQMIHGLALANIPINRKALSNLAIEDKAAFAQLAHKAKEALG